MYYDDKCIEIVYTSLHGHFIFSSIWSVSQELFIIPTTIVIHCVCVYSLSGCYVGIISETRAGPFFPLSFFSQFGTSAGISGIGIFPVLILLNIWSFGIFWRRKKLSICAGFRCLLLTRANFETLTTPPLQIPMDHTPKIEWKKHEGKKGRKKKEIIIRTHTHTHELHKTEKSVMQSQLHRTAQKKCTVYIFVLQNKKGKKENGKTIITLSTTSLQIHFLPVSCVSNV